MLQVFAVPTRLLIESKAAPMRNNKHPKVQQEEPMVNDKDSKNESNNGNNAHSQDDAAKRKLQRDALRSQMESMEDDD